MIFHYAGKFNGDEKLLPQRVHPVNSVPFKEPKDEKTLAFIANAGSVVLMIIFGIPYFLMAFKYMRFSFTFFLGCIGPMLSLVPHELLHALCFKKNVYMYEDLSHGLLFVVGNEDMTKTRFIIMSLLPNIVFGFIPYILFLVNHSFVGLGILGFICIGMGFGDYMNVYNALKQVPNGAMIYLSGFHSYWYKPMNEEIKI